MAAAASVALSIGTTVCLPSAVLPHSSLRSTSSTACSTSLAFLSSVPCLRLSSSPASKRASSNWNCARCKLPTSMASSNDKRTVVASAQGSITREVRSDGLLPKTATPLTMTYLEGNSWLFEVVGLKILIDPVLVGNLDFGIPWIFAGEKIVYKDFKLEDLPQLDYLLITQGFDDHCHEKTLGPLSRLQPNLAVIASPNAESILKKYFKKVTYLEPTTGESITLEASNGADVVIRASPGPILGPPWQRPENGYFIEAKDPKFTIYYEPHCIFANAKLEQERADVIVTPVIKQRLPAYTLVSGQEDAVKVAEWLKPKFVVTMKNGEFNATGILSKLGILAKLVKAQGTTESFQDLLAKKLPKVEVLQPVPGVPLEVPVV